MAIPAPADRVPASVVECDEALALLRTMRRSGGVEERALAQIAIDNVLDRRNELVAELAGMGAQS